MGIEEWGDDFQFTSDAPMSEMDGREYNPYRLFVASTDKQGHYWQLGNVKFPQGTEARVQQAIDSLRKRGYRTFHDFVRDAVQHRLHFWELHGDAELKEVAAKLRGTIAFDEGSSFKIRREREKMAIETWREDINVLYFEDAYLDLADLREIMAETSVGFLKVSQEQVKELLDKLDVCMGRLLLHRGFQESP